MTHRSPSDNNQRKEASPEGRLDPRQPEPPGPVLVPPGFRNPLAPVAAPPPALLPLIGADDEITPALERLLHPVAVRARHGDREARDALYRAFEPKLYRFARRIRAPWAPPGSQAVWDVEDVAQEGYLVFVSLIENWSPHIPFGPYVLANFRWRLHDAVYRRLARRGVPPRVTRVSLDAIEGMPEPASEVAAGDTLIAIVAGALEPPLAAIFRLCIVEGLSITRAARRIGMSETTARRHWQTLVTRLRAAEWTARE